MYRIYREDPDDVTSRLKFDPPLKSDELFDALRAAFPDTRPHSERVSRAVRQYYSEELQNDGGIASSNTDSSSESITTSPPNAHQAEVPKKKFICTVPSCGKVFARKCDLRKHRGCHKAYEERTHVCQQCEKRFLYPKDVKRHARQVHGLDPAPTEPVLVAEVDGGPAGAGAGADADASIEPPTIPSSLADQEPYGLTMAMPSSREETYWPPANRILHSNSIDLRHEELQDQSMVSAETQI